MKIIESEHLVHIHMFGLVIDAVCVCKPRETSDGQTIPAKINWRAFGDVGIETATEFLYCLENAIKIANKLNEEAK